MAIRGKGGGLLRALLALLLLGISAPALAQTTPYRSLTDAFATFVESTAHLPMADRVALFRTQVARLFPGFYRPRDGRSAADFNRMIARSLSSFQGQRADFEAVEHAFDATYRAELVRFRQTFPTFRLTSPVYLLHSLGEMDAGTRVIGGRRVLIFGADGIAQYDTPDALPMLLDHEFFHMVHSRSFPGCTAVWCGLWREGLAVYAASILNPGATDRQLGLEDPGQLRPAVEAHRREALCLLQSKLGTAGRSPTRLFFLSGGGTRTLPPRFGYYLGYRLAQRIGQTHRLEDLAHMPMKQARALVVATVAQMAEEAGGCATTVVAQP